MNLMILNKNRQISDNRRSMLGSMAEKAKKGTTIDRITKADMSGMMLADRMREYQKNNLLTVQN